MRPIVSELPPAANGDTMRTGFLGQSGALAAAPDRQAARSAPATAATIGRPLAARAPTVLPLTTNMAAPECYAPARHVLPAPGHGNLDRHGFPVPSRRSGMAIAEERADLRTNLFCGRAGEGGFIINVADQHGLSTWT